MKIAIASIDNMVAQHFGHCKQFVLFEIENGIVIEKKTVPNPGHKPGFLPNYLGDLGVNLIISGGMGSGAIDIFKERNITVIVGASGSAQACLESYLRGELKSTETVCHEHLHADECGQH